MNNLKFVKENVKSVVYETDNYTVKLREGGIAFPPKSMIPYFSGEEPVRFDLLIVTNKKTNKTAQTRVFQHFPLEDLDRDINVKKQFKEPIWNKIDQTVE